MGETNIELAQFSTHIYISFHLFTLFKVRANEINLRARNLKTFLGDKMQTV